MQFIAFVGELVAYSPFYKIKVVYNKTCQLLGDSL